MLFSLLKMPIPLHFTCCLNPLYPLGPSWNGGYHHPKLGVYHSHSCFYTFATYACISKQNITLLHTAVSFFVTVTMLCVSFIEYISAAFSLFNVVPWNFFLDMYTSLVY